MIICEDDILILRRKDLILMSADFDIDKIDNTMFYGRSLRRELYRKALVIFVDRGLRYKILKNRYPHEDVKKFIEYYVPELRNKKRKETIKKILDKV